MSIKKKKKHLACYDQKCSLLKRMYWLAASHMPSVPFQMPPFVQDVIHLLSVGKFETFDKYILQHCVSQVDYFSLLLAIIKKCTFHLPNSYLW